MYEIAFPKNTKRLIVRNQKVGDIIAEIQMALLDGVQMQVFEFSKQFTPSVQSLNNLWNWEKSIIKYVEDGDLQLVKEPARLYADGSGDCKSKALFIASVLLNIGCDVKIKYVHYSDIDTNHVYATAILPSGEEIIVDTVWNRFNEEKRPYKLIREQIFKPNKINNMPLYRMGATENDLSLMDYQNSALMAANIDHVNSLVAEIPDSVLDNDITEMSKTEFLSYLGYNVQGLTYDSTPAFTMPVIAYNGEMVGSIFTKIGDAIKNAFKKIINFIFKGPIQKAAPAMMYVFLNKSVNSVVDSKRAAQSQLVDYLAQKTGVSRDVMLKTIGAGIVQTTGMSVNDNLKEFVGGQNVGSAKMGIAAAIISAIIAALPKIIEIIGKIVSFFKKNDSPKVDGTAPEAGDWTPPPTPDTFPDENPMPTPSTLPSGGTMPPPFTPTDPRTIPSQGNGGTIPQSNGMNIDPMTLLLGAGILYVVTNR